tara:strand:- start:4197 stop:4613 length:417 start_codon:yes stop_codon:yes gene_type:complete
MVKKFQNKKFQKDFTFGLEQEDIIKPKLEEHFGVKLEKTATSARFDYIGENIYIELKSRRNEKYKYPTTMVGEGKYKIGLELLSQGNRIIYCFNFTDKLSFIEPQDNPVEIKTGGRCDRGRPELNKYVFFPVEDLIDI